jgi:Phosphatidylinositol 3- and 4-kinase
LKVELEDPTYGARYKQIFAALQARLKETPFSMSGLHETHVEDTVTPFKSIVDSVSKLGSTLRKGDHALGERERTSKKLTKPRSMWNVIVEQDAFITGILEIQQRCRDARGKKDAKEAELKILLSKEGFDRRPDRDPVPLPSRPDVFVNGVDPETATMFKSALYPALLRFHVEGVLESSKTSSLHTGKLNHADEHRMLSYRVIVKTGDDLRQDQLIIMMIQLMDRLLKRAALDLCLTPYSIIATSPSSGLVEFVDGAMTISLILAKYNGSILQFFQAVASQKGTKHDIRPDVLATYIRSCAGYCVITYLVSSCKASKIRQFDDILSKFFIDCRWVWVIATSTIYFCARPAISSISTLALYLVEIQSPSHRRFG